MFILKQTWQTGKKNKRQTADSIFFNGHSEWLESGTGPVNNGCQIAYAKMLKN